jgi:Kef-type K+ transport system membrane component KefB
LLWYSFIDISEKQRQSFESRDRMISRGEVGLIVAGVGATSGALSVDIYSTLIIMVAVTNIVTPIWLKKSYEKELHDDKNLQYSVR